MPIEIKELHIKATVVGEEQSAQATSERAAANQQNANVQGIIDEVVEQVMEILRNKNER